jgi:ABC-2 type transport system permease protein
VRRWRPYALVDLALAAAVLGYALSMAGARPDATAWLTFALAMAVGLAILYALLLACTAVIFWSPGLLLTWVFRGIIQMARYPLGLYPGWLRLALTWAVPVGLITTLPAEALLGRGDAATLGGALAVVLALLAGASALFRAGLRRYESASS